MENEISLVDCAYNVMKAYYKSKKKKNTVKVPFTELLLKVGEEKGITDQNQLLKMASSFYTALTVDGRFFQKENNNWSLKEYEKFEDIHKVNVTSDDDIDDIPESEIIDEDNSAIKEEFENDDDDDGDDKVTSADYNIDTSSEDIDENN